jgi:hypothetical protein
MVEPGNGAIFVPSDYRAYRRLASVGEIALSPGRGCLRVMEQMMMSKSRDIADHPVSRTEVAKATYMDGIVVSWLVRRTDHEAGLGGAKRKEGRCRSTYQGSATRRRLGPG